MLLRNYLYLMLAEDISRKKLPKLSRRQLPKVSREVKKHVLDIVEVVVSWSRYSRF